MRHLWYSDTNCLGSCFEIHFASSVTGLSYPSGHKIGGPSVNIHQKDFWDNSNWIVDHVQSAGNIEGHSSTNVHLRTSWSTGLIVEGSVDIEESYQNDQWCEIDG